VTRYLVIASIVLAFVGGGSAAALGFQWFPVRVVRVHAVFGADEKATPMKAFYIRDEWNAETLCTRVLMYEPTGQFAAQTVPDAFCTQSLSFGGSH
jgi:hypothetical protein